MITDFSCWVDVDIARFQKYKKNKKNQNLQKKRRKKEKERKGKVKGLVWRPSKTSPIHNLLQWKKRGGEKFRGRRRRKFLGGTVESKKRTLKKNLKPFSPCCHHPWKRSQPPLPLRKPELSYSGFSPQNQKPELPPSSFEATDNPEPALIAAATLLSQLVKTKKKQKPPTQRERPLHLPPLCRPLSFPLYQPAKTTLPFGLRFLLLKQPLCLDKASQREPFCKKRKKHWPSLSCSSSRLNREPSTTGQQSTHRPPSPGWRHSHQAKTAPLRTTEQPHLPRPENGQSRSRSPQTHGSRFSQQVFPSSAAEQPPAAATTQQRPQTGSPWSCHRPPETEEEEIKNLQRCGRSEQGEGRGADLKTKLKQTCLLRFGCFAGNGVAHSRQEGEEGRKPLRISPRSLDLAAAREPTAPQFLRSSSAVPGLFRDLFVIFTCLNMYLNFC